VVTETRAIARLGLEHTHAPTRDAPGDEERPGTDVSADLVDDVIGTEPREEGRQLRPLEPLADEVAVVARVAHVEMRGFPRDANANRKPARPAHCISRDFRNGTKRWRSRAAGCQPPTKVLSSPNKSLTLPG